MVNNLINCYYARQHRVDCTKGGVKMYLYKSGIDFKNQKEKAEIIGISESFLSRILNKKQSCSKIVAYCVTKAFNDKAEILDYFTKI